MARLSRSGAAAEDEVNSILDRYQAILLDMNGTFMFDEDRFGPGQDYHATYRALGGIRLTPDAVRRAVSGCYEQMAAMYEESGRTESFPPVRDVLAESLAWDGLPTTEIELVESVIARHELGRVPEEYANALQGLARTHLLGVVTNIWSRKPPWLDEFGRAGIFDLFTTVVFSSDGPSIKPSPVLFRQALAALPVRPSSVVFVGDSLRCDIGGATAAGLDSVWINYSRAPRHPSSPTPTFVIRSLLELVWTKPAAAGDPSGGISRG